MKFCGIICEFNPLTNGHQFIIEEAKKQTGLPVIALMSGDFTQRGEPASINKYARAKMAIDAGCDFCLELPTAFAISPAKNFAEGAIKCLTELGCVSHLVFGSECGNLEVLQEIAEFLNNPTPEFSNEIKANLNNGNSYLSAHNAALTNALPHLNINEILKGANNILAIEYLKALKKEKSNIIPLTIKRCDNGFNTKKSKQQFLSASAIRANVLEGKLNKIKKFVPPFTFNALKNSALFNFPAFRDYQKLSIRFKTASDLNQLFDYNEGIEHLVLISAQKNNTHEEILEAISTKRYRPQRIERLMLYPILNLTKSVHTQISTTPATLKLLATKAENKTNIKHLTKGEAKIIVTSKDYLKHNTPSLTLDLLASNTYNAFANLPHNHDLTTGTLFI